MIGYLPDIAEAVIAFLGTAAIGAVWSACGQDYSATAALGRFGQLEPRVLVLPSKHSRFAYRYLVERPVRQRSTVDGRPSSTPAGSSNVLLFLRVKNRRTAARMFCPPSKYA